MMKVFVVLAACFVASSIVTGEPQFRFGSDRPPITETGVSSQYRSEDDNGNYQFGYNELHSSGGTSRREEQANGLRTGSYSLSDADGRQRIVDYFADESGFHAFVRTNEPGVESKDSADVSVNKHQPAFVALPGTGRAPLLLPSQLLQQLPLSPAPLTRFEAQFPLQPTFRPLPPPLATLPPIKGLDVPLNSAKYLPPSLSQRTTYADEEESTSYEDETPRAFSYAFGTHHYAPSASLYQQRLESY